MFVWTIVRIQLTLRLPHDVSHRSQLFLADSPLGSLGTALGPILGSKLGTFAKSLRLLRIVVLMNMIKPIRVILETLIACLPALSNIIALLFLVYSIFAVIAVQLFGTTRFGWRHGPTAKFDSWVPLPLII